MQTTISCLSAGLILLGTLCAQNPPRKMPREDVVEVPAIADGLCLSNAFQSHMVIQRDKPITVWGWAAPGEKVTVAFGGQSAVATAGDDRSWKLELPAMSANDRPQVMTVQGRDKSLKLENILVGDDWIMEETPVKFPLPLGGDLRSMARKLKGKIRTELVLQDRERRIREAVARVAEMKEKVLADRKSWEESKAKEAEKIRAAQEQAQ